MKIFSCEQIQSIDSYTIEHEPILSIDLMERAAFRLFSWIVKHYSCSKHFHVFVGPGNNGGDGLALSRLLIQVGYNVSVFILESSNYSLNHQINLQRLQKQGVETPKIIKSSTDFPVFHDECIVLDCLFGSGLTRPLKGLAVGLVEHVNSFNGTIVSVDIPSGLFGDINPELIKNTVVRAHITLTLQFPKFSFFFPENHKYVGEWYVIDIDLHRSIIEQTKTPYSVITAEVAGKVLKKRSKFDHKTLNGHSLLVAGSLGMFGAAVLCASACVKSGAGLVSIHVPRAALPVLQQSVPEALVQVDINDLFFTGVSTLKSYTAIGVGPGLGLEPKTVSGILGLFKNATCPMVIDADGLNVLSKSVELLKLVPANSILTPHVGEFNRLFTATNLGASRLKVAIEMAWKYNVIIIIKGAFSQIVCPDGRVYFNSTGNPGMATGGSGDVLTGIITSLLGQGYTSVDSAILGVFLHGLAGDIALKELGAEALTASSIVKNIGKAFRSISKY